MNVYDFDKTIYSSDASVDFFLFCLKHKKSTRWMLPKLAVYTFAFAFKLISIKRYKQEFFAFTKILDDTDAYVKRFWNENKSKIYPWYIEKKNKSDIIISASPSFLLKPMTDSLEIGKLIATEYSLSSHKIIGENCKGKEKVNRLRAYDPSATIDEFYSDSYSDTPLARLASQSFLVKNGELYGWDMKNPTK
jgi:phosphatidylglycerophosphatase C